MLYIKIIKDSQDFQLPSKWHVKRPKTELLVDKNGKTVSSDFSGKCYKVLTVAKLSDSDYNQRRLVAILALIFTAGFAYICWGDKIKSLLANKRLYITPKESQVQEVASQPLGLKKQQVQEIANQPLELKKEEDTRVAKFEKMSLKTNRTEAESQERLECLKGIIRFEYSSVDKELFRLMSFDDFKVILKDDNIFRSFMSVFRIHANEDQKVELLPLVVDHIIDFSSHYSLSRNVFNIASMMEIIEEKSIPVLIKSIQRDFSKFLNLLCASVIEGPDYKSPYECSLIIELYKSNPSSELWEKIKMNSVSFDPRFRPYVLTAEILHILKDTPSEQLEEKLKAINFKLKSNIVSAEKEVFKRLENIEEEKLQILNRFYLSHK